MSERRWWRKKSKVAPTRKAAFLPGDLVHITLNPGDVCAEFNNRHGVVTYGPDSDGGWHVSSAPGSIRCVSRELTMITPREER
jgi:hypothetical protein